MAPSASTLTRSTSWVDEAFPSTPAATKREKKESRRPTALEAAFAIVDETGCSQAAAEAFVEFATYAAAHPETEGRDAGAYILSQTDWRRHHAVMDGFMPDEAKAAKGSAHDVLNRHLGVTLRHTMRADRCGIAIAVN